MGRCQTYALRVFRPRGHVVLFASLALGLFTAGALAKAPKVEAPDTPPGSVLLSQGRFSNGTWFSYAIKSDPNVCIYLNGGGLFWNCLPPAQWVPAETIAVDNWGTGGPPWRTQEVIRTRGRVASVKVTMECGANFSRPLRHLTKRDRRKTGLPRGVRFFPFVRDGAQAVRAATAYDARGRRIGHVDPELPPRESRPPLPC